VQLPPARGKTVTLTAREKERAGDRNPTALMSPRYADSQAEGLRVLLSIAVDRAEDLLGEIALRDEEALTGPIDALKLAQEPGVTNLPLTEPTRARAHQSPRVRTAGSGRHAASIPPLHRRGLRFVIFSAIGGFVFLLGLGLQVVLTGGFHVLPVVSYLIQAVVSVEVSFLLNRWLTWRDRDTPFWPAFVRFNAQKVVTIALNLALYAGLLRLGVNYLVANVVLTVLFTVVNFVAGDRLVFVPRRARTVQPTAPAVPKVLAERLARSVSVVIPCRDNERTIGAAVQSLLDQDYPGLAEIILVGSPGDPTWNGLAGLDDPRLTICEMETPPGLRDANFKRDAAIRKTSGDLIALMDSDVVLPSDWISRAVATMEDSGESCVTGGLKSVHNSFWGRYTDSTWIGAKTPRIAESYTVTSADFGMQGRKPPITANALVTRELYDHCPIDPSWSHGSYEDYEWFWRVTKAGYGIFVCRELFGWHHHRRGLRALAKEYRRSSKGCAYFIRAHRDCPLARRRLRQVIILPLTALAVVTAMAAATATGHGIAVAAGVLGCAAVLAVHQVARSRSLESLAYPLAGLALGVVYTTSLATNLIQSGSAISPVTSSLADEPQTGRSQERPRRRLPRPIMAICAIQAALSLTLVWSNTAFVDEADYLWIGHLETAQWLHGTSWPSVYADQTLSGSPFIYPPLGALADSIGGLAGARILSLMFMLGATILLYLTASRLFDRTTALFASALWAFTEPTIRLAFATFDPLSILLTALSAWLIVQAGYRRHRGEFVASAAVILALANVTAYSGIAIDPVVVAFAFLAWLPRMGAKQASFCTAWFAGALAAFFAMLMTLSHSWSGLIYTVLDRSVTDQQSTLLVLEQVWAYSGLIICLAVIGMVTAVRAGGRQRAALLVLLGCAVFIVPAAQLHDQTSFSLDKHLAYGIWFAAIASGWACGKLIKWVPGASRKLTAICCVVALSYTVASSWESAWERYHGWANAHSFIAAFGPLAARSTGLIYASGQNHIAEYYTPEGGEWPRWSTALQLDPANLPENQWSSYYSKLLSNENYGIIVLFYSTTFSSASLQPNIPLVKDSGATYEDLLDLVGQNSGEPGLPELTKVLAADPSYQLEAQGPYNSGHDLGIYAIWQKKEQT
jgi:putative flippase GtrA/GT2 family glycosyltransferase